MYRFCKVLYGAPVALEVRFPRVCVCVCVSVCAGRKTKKKRKKKGKTRKMPLPQHHQSINQSINRQKPQTRTPSASPYQPYFSEEPPPDHSSSNPSSSANYLSFPTSLAPAERRPTNCAGTAVSSPPNATAPAAVTPPKAADIVHCERRDRAATGACGTDYIVPLTGVVARGLLRQRRRTRASRTWARCHCPVGRPLRARTGGAGHSTPRGWARGRCRG